MEYRPLGRTGVKVSPLCLGAMMFGPWGNNDQADSIRIIHARPGCRHQLRRHRRRLLRRRFRGDPRRSAARPPRRRRAGDQVLHAHGRRPEPPRGVAPLDHDRGRELVATTGHRPHRPLPGAPAEPRHRPRGNPRRAHRPRPAGKGPLPRLVVLLRLPDRRSPMDVPRPAPRTIRHRAAPLLHPRARHRNRCPANDSALRHGRPDLQPAGRGLAVRTVAQGQRQQPDLVGPAQRPFRPEHAGQPAQARCRRAARPSSPSTPDTR